MDVNERDKKREEEYRRRINQGFLSNQPVDGESPRTVNDLVTAIEMIEELLRDMSSEDVVNHQWEHRERQTEAMEAQVKVLERIAEAVERLPRLMS